MEIPESINNLTTEVSTTSITQIDIQKNIDTTGILESLKHNTSLSDFRDIEIGLAFYKKDAVSDKNFINNILLLYADTVKKAISTSNVSDEYKPILSKSFNDAINGIVGSLNALYDITFTLNKKKNILDVQRVSCIMLGYAIAIIKKIHNH
jgi:hypothetical protein